jgi:hypothetical protein
MKYIHTFWSKPLVEKKFADYNSSLTIILTDYAYSANCIHKLGETIELYADEYGAELLSFIPYDKVHIVNGLENESKHFAAQIKFHALKDCELGDILIDGDLFIRKPKANEIIKTYKNFDIVYSFFEPPQYTINSQERAIYYSLGVNKFISNNIHFEEPYYWPLKPEDYGWINASLTQFNNQELKDKYIEQYFKHKDLLKHVNWEKFWPDIVIEQKFLTLLSEKYSKKAIIENFYFDPEANNKALDIGFTHLGNLKQMLNEQITSMFINDNKNLYNKMIEQLNKYKK